MGSLRFLVALKWGLWGAASAGLACVDAAAVWVEVGRTGLPPFPLEDGDANRLIRSSASSRPCEVALEMGTGGLCLVSAWLGVEGMMCVMAILSAKGKTSSENSLWRGIDRIPTAKQAFWSQFTRCTGRQVLNQKMRQKRYSHTEWQALRSGIAGTQRAKGLARPLQKICCLRRKKETMSKNLFCPLHTCQAATIFSPPRCEQLRLTADTDFGWLRFPGPAEKPTNWRIRGTNR